VNNVGVIDIKKVFELSPQELESIIRVNIFTQVFFTKYARQTMPSDKHNLMIHLSSLLGDVAFPFYGTYSGTKTFNRVFGKLMHENQRTNKPDTLIVKPGGILTNMTKGHQSSSYVPPEDVIQGMFREIGINWWGCGYGYREVNGCMNHNLLGFQMAISPSFVKHWFRLYVGK
jgi:short-subunit dehydrogenase